MKIKHLTLAIAFCLGTAASAQAETFKYSYTVNNGLLSAAQVNGSFDGTASGNFITNLSHISAFVNGNAFIGNGSLYVAAFTSRGAWISGGVVSFDGKENNFGFTNSDLTAGDYSFTGIVHSVNKSIMGGQGIQQALITSGGLNINSIDRSTAPSNWSVTAVPEPETYAMLLAGLGLIGAAVKRRKEKQA